MAAESFFAEPGFKVGKSLRFNDDDTAKLSRTFGSSGNTKKWTYSCWVKRANLDGQSHTLFATDRSGTNDFDYIRIQTDDSVYAAVYSDDEEYHLRIITNRKLRDLNTWYHIVVRYDSTAGTPASPENALYINGVLEDDLAAGVTPDQNAVSNFNNNVVHRIGNWNANAAFNLDGHLAEVNFVDGYSLPASYFGETNTVGNQWIPIQYSGAYGNNGFYLPMSGSGLTASGGNSTGTYTAGGISFKQHTFTSSGTFTVSDTPPGANFDVLVVAGGGGGGWSHSGGGGAGGVIIRPVEASTTAAYTITIGAGAAALSSTATYGNQGGDTTIAVGGSTILTAKGGGGGATTYNPGADGGSGGGGGRTEGTARAGGSQTQTGQSGASGIFGFGKDGGASNYTTSTPSYPTAGGGGAGAVGGTPVAGNSASALSVGGVGIVNAFSGTSYTWAGGGGGHRYNSNTGQSAGAAGAGGAGGGGGGAHRGDDGAGGAGGASALNAGGAGVNDEFPAGGGDGGANTGGGGGAGGGAGGSGIVIIRYAT